MLPLPQPTSVLSSGIFDLYLPHIELSQPQTMTSAYTLFYQKLIVRILQVEKNGILKNRDQRDRTLELYIVNPCSIPNQHVVL